MTGNAKQSSGQVEQFPRTAIDRALGEQLGQLRDMLLAEFPQAEEVTLSFNGQLHAHIDLRKGEELMFVEQKLAGMAGGMFSQVRRGPAPHHPFLHRVSTLVDR